MTDLTDLAAVTATIHAQARSGNVRFTLHAHEEMIEDGIHVDQVLEAVQGCQILENYAEHRRGACCLVLGYLKGGRPLHVVCTTSNPVLVVVTVYAPRRPKWNSPTQRGRAR